MQQQQQQRQTKIQTYKNCNLISFNIILNELVGVAVVFVVVTEISVAIKACWQFQTLLGSFLPSADTQIHLQHFCIYADVDFVLHVPLRDNRSEHMCINV